MTTNQQQINLLIGVTGSVATIKLPLLIKEFKEKFNEKFKDKNLEIKVVYTDNSLNFFSFDNLKEQIKLYGDKDEWNNWNKITDPILHIELRNWADILLISPLDANTLAKLANGICDNLLTCIVRAWNLSKPLYFAPAMNTHMYNHPFTCEHLNRLNKLGYTEISVIEKKLACGDKGKGAMEEYYNIVDLVLNKIN